MSWLHMAVITTIALTVQVAFHLSVWRRLVRDTRLPRRARRLATGVLVALALSIPATMTLHRLRVPAIADHLAWVSMPWLAMLGLLVLTLAAIDLVRGVRFLAARVQARRAGTGGARPADPERRAVLARITGGAAVAIAGGAVAVGVKNALGPHRIVDVEVPLRGLGRDLDGFTIVQVTDLHAGLTVGRGYVADVVERAMALSPDLVAVTGDVVDGTVAHLRDRVAPLAGLHAPHGVFLVTGNHEYYSGVDAWLRELAGLGLRPLRNERVRITRGAAGFDLAGVDDHDAAGFGHGHGADYGRALGGRDRSVPVVLLAHQPRQVEDAAPHGVDLQLSGHTHGGQIWPWHYIVRAQQGGLVAGRYRRGDTEVFVCRGCGYWGPPVRLGARPELGRIVLRAA
ncbi:MAG TPA: metallophosphoesterase [Kofleriaceae bacterium]|nr:metallophosphoesterase [Kofleriaceae bacterium]